MLDIFTTHSGAEVEGVHLNRPRSISYGRWVDFFDTLKLGRRPKLAGNEQDFWSPEVNGMSSPDAEADWQGVTINGQRIERPRRIAPSQWLRFWDALAALD